AKLGPTSPDYWHLLVEAKKVAFADRAKFYADPVFAKVPVGDLVSKEYAAGRAKLIDPRKARTDIPAGDPKLGAAETIYLGVMGGDMQPQGHVQVLVNMIDFGMNVQQAGEAPRVEHVGSATPTGLPGSAGGGTIRAEIGIPDAVLAELKGRGHRVETVRVNG